MKHKLNYDRVSNSEVRLVSSVLPGLCYVLYRYIGSGNLVESFKRIILDFMKLVIMEAQ